MNFDTAVQHLNEGRVLRRAAWVADNAVFRLPGYTVAPDEIDSLHGASDDVKRVLKLRDWHISWGHQVLIINPEHIVSTWLPDDYDVEAEDGEIV